jgi:hypothetical protein
MDIVPPATGPALIILVAFVLPGFVTVLIQERTFKSAEDQTGLDRLLRILYYSIWVYLLVAVFALIFHIDRESIEVLYEEFEGDPAELVWRGTLAILVPSFLIAHTTRLWSGSQTQSRLLRTARINERHEQPTAWDYFFRQRHNVYVRVTMGDGARVLGFYGAKSFAAYAKDGGDLYLERHYMPTEVQWFGPEPDDSHGVWIKMGDAIAVEFYDPVDATKIEPTETRPTLGQAREGGPQTPDSDCSAA